MAISSTTAPESNFRENELPSAPEYAVKMAELDATLVAAIECADTAEEPVLAHVFRCELGSLRYRDALDV